MILFYFRHRERKRGFFSFFLVYSPAKLFVLVRDAPCSAPSCHFILVVPLMSYFLPGPRRLVLCETAGDDGERRRGLHCLSQFGILKAGCSQFAARVGYSLRQEDAYVVP